MAARGAPRLCTAPDGLSAYKNFDLRLDELLDEPSCAVGRLLAREWPLVQNERFSWLWLSRRCRAISRRQGAHRRSRRSPTHQNSSRSRSVRYGAADDGCRRESAGLRHQDTRCARAPHALPLGRCGSSRLSSSARDEPKGVSHARLGRSDGPNPSSARPRRWTLWRLAVETYCFCRQAGGAWPISWAGKLSGGVSEVTSQVKSSCIVRRPAEREREWREKRA